MNRTRVDVLHLSIRVVEIVNQPHRFGAKAEGPPGVILCSGSWYLVMIRIGLLRSVARCPLNPCQADRDALRVSAPGIESGAVTPSWQPGRGGISACRS